MILRDLLHHIFDNSIRNTKNLTKNLQKYKEEKEIDNTVSEAFAYIAEESMNGIKNVFDLQRFLHFQSAIDRVSLL